MATPTLILIIPVVELKKVSCFVTVIVLGTADSMIAPLSSFIFTVILYVPVVENYDLQKL